MIYLVAILLSHSWFIQDRHTTQAATVPKIPINETSIFLSGTRVNLSPLAAADFNRDGYKEIIAASQDGVLWVVATTDGQNWTPVWSRQTNLDIQEANPPSSKNEGRIDSAPAIADLDNNGTLEIVITVGGDTNHPDRNRRWNGGVLVYTYQSPWNFSLIQPLSADGTSGWPQPRIDQIGWPPPGFSFADGYWDGLTTTAALGDLDGDGDLEVIVEGSDRRLHAWHHTGEVVEGWPLYSENGDNLTRSGMASPALADLDDDGLPEVVFGTMNNETTLWVVNGDSTSVPGFPLTVEQYIHSSPAIGDIDNDGQPEIVAATGWGKSGGRTNVVYAWNHDGTVVDNWPVETAGSTAAPPALGDIDNDGDLEVVVACGSFIDFECNKLYAWHGNGQLVAGFPMIPPITNPGLPGGIMLNPILADFDGDDIVEIFVLHIGGWAYVVVEPNGVASDNTTFRMPGDFFVPPLIDDVDNDGSLEILAAGIDYDNQSQPLIRIWDVAGSTKSARPWPMFRQNQFRDGRFSLPRLPRPPEIMLDRTSILFFHQQGTTKREVATVNLKNIGELPFDWSAAHTIRNLQLSQNSGTELVNQTQIQISLDVGPTPTRGIVSLGSIQFVATADGQSVQSSPQTLSIFLFTGDVQSFYLPVISR
ncbi:VCBS repeat-containing protein [Chloroflexi bacterium TSY]|nr:VCBS repeat-containing protein [Chloroflexi bacterium TSY]